MADKNFKVPFPGEDYKGIIEDAATRKGWREKVRSEGEGREVIDNPQSAEEFLTKAVFDEFVQIHVRSQTAKAGQKASAEAVAEAEEALKEKFGL